MNLRRSRALPLLAAVMVLLPVCSRAQDVDDLTEQKPFTLNGSLGVSATAYSVSGIERRRVPFSWTINGSAGASFYGVQLPFSFVFSEQERDFRQPFNQFGISPNYKWATAHLGYRSMTFSRYTLAGVTFLGAGFEATPGVLRLGAMYGRMQRAVEEDTTQLYNLPAYERNGYAFKLGFGSEANYFDLSYLRAKDDTNSLRLAPLRSDVYPSENAVIGMNAKFTVIPELSFELEGAGSLFTRDLRSPALDLDSNDIPDFLLDFYDAKTSTTLTVAARAGINFTIPHFGLRLGYERIEPDFNSLGAYYFTTDIENWTIAPSFDLFENALRVGGSFGIQRDNLLDTKLAETSRLIGSGTVSWNPNQTFGIDAQYTNYSTGQSAGRIPMNDTVRVRNVTQSASLAPRILIQTPELNHFVTLVAGVQQYTDLNAFTNALTDTDSKTASLIYNLTFVQSAISTGVSVLYADSQAGTFSTKVIGTSLNGSIGLLDNQMTVAGSVGFSRSSIDGLDASSSVFNETVNASYRLTREDVVNFSLYGTQNSGAGGLSSPDFNELTATLSYSRSFSIEP